MRLGLHVHTAEPGSREEALAREYIRRVQPPMVKVLGGAFQSGFLDFCREQGTEIVGRVVFGPHDQKLAGAKAGKLMKEIRRRAEENPQITWWEFYNESYNGADDEEEDEFSDYADLCIEFMDEMAEIGRKAAIGSFSTGTPDESAWERFMPAVAHAWHNGHAICIHQYSCPDMRYLCGENQIVDGVGRLTDPCLSSKVEGLLTLRHRKFLRIIEQHGVSARLFIGESGNDDIQNRHPGGQGKGWRDWWANDRPLLLSDFADQMRWYCWQLSHDPAVIGVVDYGWAPGHEGEEQAWHSFDLSHMNDPNNAELAAIRERLIDGQQSLPRTGKPASEVYDPLPPFGAEPGGIPVPPPAFPAGSRVRNALNVSLRVRRTPGFIGKPAEDVVGRLGAGAAATVLDGRLEERDELSWLRVRHADDAAVEGWAAVAGPEGEAYLVRE